MSDTSGVAESGDVGAEVSAPAEGGGESVGAEATPAAPPDYLDLDQYGGHHVRTRVAGEDLDIPLSEALAGYSRQADYTRKTQELAEQQRQAQYAMTLQQALENNPELTLRLLQEQYGGAPQQQPSDDDDMSWLDDPQDAKMREYEDRLSGFEQWKADQELQVALSVLHQQFGDDFDANAVVNQAMRTGRMDLANIHKEMMFDRIWAQHQAQAESDRRRQADEERRTNAKAGLTPQMGGGVTDVVEPPDTGTYTSLADAYYASKKQLGLT